jgi:hypothetical protein
MVPEDGVTTLVERASAEFVDLDTVKRYLNE